MNIIFGPVPSRRLGRSLGIDPTPSAALPGTARISPSSGKNPRKICNWNCVYCQLGRTRPFTRARARFFNPEALRAELRRVLGSESTGPVDWITFVGTGEPTLNSDLGTMLRGIRDETDLPVAVITNGSLLSRPEVRRELAPADAVLPTLDAGSPALFRRINRAPSEYTFKLHLEGLVDFRSEFTGKLWLETMLLENINDDESSLRDLAAAVGRIAPDEIHLLLPTRPPAEPWVLPASREAVLRAESILGEIAPVVQPDQRYGEFGRKIEEDPLDAAARILVRHPMTDEELRSALKAWGVPDADAVLRALTDSGKARKLSRYGRTFWSGSTDPDRYGV